MRKKALPLLASTAVLFLAGHLQIAHSQQAVNKPVPPKPWIIWPKNSESILTRSNEGKSTFELQIKKPTTVYRWVATKPNTLYHINFFYRARIINGAAKSDVRLSYRSTGETPKALGNVHFPLALSANDTHWTPFSAVTVSPPDKAQTMQFNFNINAESGTFAFKDVSIEEEKPVSAQASATAHTTPFAPDNAVWKNQPALSNFWNVDTKGEPASQKTDVQITYDKNALYVLFTNYEPNTEQLEKAQTERDGSIWNDDSDEIYLVTPNGNAYQFIVGAANGKWDGKLVQKVDGDPYTADKSWNGDWDSAVKIDTDRWWTSWRIPFKTLGENPQNGAEWRINFVRHHYAGSVRESTRWTYANGKATELDRYGYLRFGDKSAEIERFIEAMELHPLKVDRPNKVYQEALTSAPGGYHTENWSHDFYLKLFPKSFQEKYTTETWKKELEARLKKRGESKMYGPFLPGAFNAAGGQLLTEAHRKYGMTFPYTMTTSGNDKIALENGAKYFNNEPNGVAKARVVEFDPAKRASILESFDKFIQRNPTMRDLIAYFYVVDEPSNSMRAAFSRTKRTDAKDILDNVDAEIRKSFGNGKYGLYDFYGTDDKNSPYERIAFLKWWNAQMDNWGKQVREGLKERAPKIPILLSNQNTVSGIPFIDVPLLSRYSDMVSVDPYPSATLALYSRARALYHTGFATKWIHDLSGGKDTTTIAQGFVYHGVSPSPDDVREWASQAMKNGAQTLSWYASGPAELTIPDTWNEIQKINKQVGTMNKLAIPTSTKTAIYHSFTSQAGLNDTVLDGEYTVYSLLGERIGSWFNFTGDGQAAQDLSSYNLIYVPSASYLSKESAQALLKRVKDGATVVFFDPLSLSESDLGESLSSIRSELIGGTLGKQRKAVQLSVKGGVIKELPKDTQLPLTPIAQGIHRGSVLAYDIEAPKDAQVFATFEDGKPAGYSRNVDKGRVIYFAAHPFGNSDLAIKDSAWEDLMRGLQKDAGEPMDLPIWRFYLSQ